jgi:predicted Zn finger-like uncharacterized protein
MRHITHCPACETQFFVSDEQLNQHEGKVRCGQCLHVFNARQQFVDTPDTEETTPETESNPEIAAPAAPEEIVTPVPEAPFAESIPSQPTPIFATVEDTLTADYQPSHFDDFLDRTKLIRTRRQHRWVWWLLTIVFLVAALLQLSYYLRNEIALYYPKTKTYLVQACQLLNCKIELPKKIEFIVIDDSDIQEDAQHTGLIWLSSTLVNQAAFNQTYPNIELTLTDVEDKPKFRKLISPQEYMPAGTDLSKGLAANEEIRIRLPIDTHREVLAGYRVLVTY